MGTKYLKKALSLIDIDPEVIERLLKHLLKKLTKETAPRFMNDFEEYSIQFQPKKKNRHYGTPRTRTVGEVLDLDRQRGKRRKYWR